MDLLIPSSPGGLPTLSLTINSSWLPWGRVAMPLISSLMLVPHGNYLLLTSLLINIYLLSCFLTYLLTSLLTYLIYMLHKGTPLL